MIAAILDNNLIVEILDAQKGTAFVLNLGRENIGDHYVGGEGYKGCRSRYYPASRFAHVALLADDDPCLTAYLDIQHDVDRLAAEGSPDLATAQDLEACAFENLRAHIITNSLPRTTVAVETAPKFDEIHLR